jgi:hypothetical protein
VIPLATFHWVRLEVPPGAGEGDQPVQEVWAVHDGKSAIELTTRHVRRLRLYLHPKMLDLSSTIRVVANGKIVHRAKVQRSVATMLALAKEFDDRGRLFHACLDLKIALDAEVPEPTWPH